jgi:hypothetical protein
MLPLKEEYTMNKNKNQIITRWQDETALNRFQMIAPLQNESLDSAKRIFLRRRIAAENNLSEKTVKRYEDLYQANGFEGLKPKSRLPHNRGKLPDGYDELVQEAIQLRREV